MAAVALGACHPLAGRLDRRHVDALRAQPTVYVVHDYPVPLRLSLRHTQLMTLTFDDPVARVAETTAAQLALQFGLANLRALETPSRADRLDVLTPSLGQDAVLHVRTTDWELRYHPDDPDAIVLDYRAALRVVGPGSRDAVWEGTCEAAPRDVRSPLPTLAELLANDRARLRAAVDEAADACARDLVARMLGREPPRRDKVEVRARRLGLAEVERRLVGADGVVGGDRRFDAEFEDVWLAAPELGALRALLARSLAAPRGSELKLEGRVEGWPFKVRLEKNTAGRSEVRLEGIHFADEAALRDFVTPLMAPGVRQVRVQGLVGGRRTERRLRP